MGFTAWLHRRFNITYSAVSSPHSAGTEGSSRGGTTSPVADPSTRPISATLILRWHRRLLNLDEVYERLRVWHCVAAHGRTLALFLDL